MHAGCVWDADFLPNGDLITACADHFVRIWTTAPERAAAADVIEAYNASMAAASSAGMHRHVMCLQNRARLGCMSAITETIVVFQKHAQQMIREDQYGGMRRDLNACGKSICNA